MKGVVIGLDRCAGITPVRVLAADHVAAVDVEAVILGSELLVLGDAAVGEPFVVAALDADASRAIDVHPGHRRELELPRIFDAEMRVAPLARFGWRIARLREPRFDLRAQSRPGRCALPLA